MGPLPASRSVCEDPKCLSETVKVTHVRVHNSEKQENPGSPNVKLQLIYTC